MKLLPKQPSVSLSLAEYKGPDTFGKDLIRAYMYETFGLLLRRKPKKNKRNVGQVSALNFFVIDMVCAMKQDILLLYVQR